MAPYESTTPSDSTNRPNSDATNEPSLWIVDRLTPNTSFSYGVTTVHTSAQTPYQQLLIGDLGPYGRALFLDGLLQTAEGDEPLYHEPIVHTPCLVHGAPKSVLILGGADGGAAREALRWRTVCSVVIVDLDATVVEACRQYLGTVANGSFDDPRTTLVIDDALNYIANCDQKFDVIVCDLTDPVPDGPSISLFTPNFFKSLRTRLSPRGALCVQSGSASPCETATVLPRVCASLRAAFTSIRPMQIFVPTYASPLALTLASNSDDELPSVEKVDSILESQVAGELTVLDGQTFHGQFAIPKFLRKAVEKERRPLQLENESLVS